MQRFKGGLVSPWDDISITYVVVVTNFLKNKPEDAFKEQSKLISWVCFVQDLLSCTQYRASSFFRFFTLSSGWTLQTLFALLRDLRQLAYDVRSSLLVQSFGSQWSRLTSEQRITDAMVIIWRMRQEPWWKRSVIAWSIGATLATCRSSLALSKTLRVSPLPESRKWGVYYVVGLVLKSYFRVSFTIAIHAYAAPDAF